jgi:hypothetical protein
MPNAAHEKNWPEELHRLGFVSFNPPFSDDLSDSVLAEDIECERIDDILFEIRFTFRCPYCNRSHSATEIDGTNVFSTVAWTLECGDVLVRMPWAQRV